MVDKEMISEIAVFLRPKLALLDTHPNTAAENDFVVPESFLSWWNNPPIWIDLLDTNHEAPQLARDAIEMSVKMDQTRTHRISVKKHHEVSRMTQFIADLFDSRFPDIDPCTIHIVDIGSGKAYLTRALHALFNAPTLAIDSNLAQSNAAQARGPDSSNSNRITFKTIHINSHYSLINAINHWIPPSSSKASPTPVLLVALHACGSLTPHIFRAFHSALKNTSQNPTWTPIAVVAVGCCYNLMSLQTDFPLSSCLLSADPPIHLSKSAFQLAAQVPSHWNDSPSSLAAAALAIRKVVWRALLTRSTHIKPDPDIGTGSSPAMRRLGRLNDSAYSNWDTFLKTAVDRLGLEENFHSVDASTVEQGASDSNSSHTIDSKPSSSDPNRGRDALLERRLEVLHVSRCLLGPVVESLIVLDRVQWVKEMLTEIGIWVDPNGDGEPDQDARAEKNANTTPSRLQVETVNLFDQATGSGRNIAIVVAPPPAIPQPFTSSPE
jgi:hypothetical protein